VVLSGESLIILNEDSNLTALFDKLVETAAIVIACRVSPIQKADLVNMVKKKYPLRKTLAIGDGANDVNMITAAHVGIGISGLEGMQAARSADFSIAQFSYLIPLLFIHGREAYRRNSFVIIYSFYKSVLFVMPQFWFGLFSVFSG